MEFHVHAERKDVARYVFCPGSQARAGRMADRLKDAVKISDERGIIVYSGSYKGVFMTVCGTGMGGPATAIACEELAHLGADTFIRVGSCGVLQEGQKSGDIIIASGTYRNGGTGTGYLPLPFPAVPTFEITRALVRSAEFQGIPVRVGVGIANDAFYGTRKSDNLAIVRSAGGIFIEMESDALFIIGHARGWRTGALFTSDGEPGVTKPERGQEAYARSEVKMIQISLEAMLAVAQDDPP